MALTFGDLSPSNHIRVDNGKVPIKILRKTVNGSSFSDTWFKLFLRVYIFGLIFLLLFYSIKQSCKENGCSAQSDSRTPPLAEAPRSHDSTGLTVSFNNSAYASSSQDARKSDNAAEDSPPDCSTVARNDLMFDNAVANSPSDYSTVTLNDLTHPTKPALPVVKKEIGLFWDGPCNSEPRSDDKEDTCNPRETTSLFYGLLNDFISPTKPAFPVFKSDNEIPPPE